MLQMIQRELQTAMMLAGLMDVVLLKLFILGCANLSQITSDRVSLPAGGNYFRSKI